MKRSELKRKTPLKRTPFQKAPMIHRIVKTKPNTEPAVARRARNSKYSRKMNRAVQKHGFKDYDAYITSREWGVFRARAFQAWGISGCLVCGTEPATIHHITYVRICQERPSDVIPLCVLHHDQVHAWHKMTCTDISKIREALQAILGCSMARVDLALARRAEMIKEGC